MASLATKSAQERKEETLALVQGQNIFAYADIALVEELQNIFEQERAKQEQTDANVNEAEENEDRDAEPEDGGIEGEPEEAQPLDTKEIAIKIYKLAGSKKIKTLNELFILREDRISMLVDARYLGYEVNLYEYVPSVNQYKEFQYQGNRYPKDIALNLAIRFRTSDQHDKVFQKSYYINIEDLSRETTHMEEVLGYGRMQFYKTK